jgi:hypothetical protein
MRLVVAALGIFATTIVISYVVLITKALTIEQVKEIQGIQFPVVASLSGITLGYYFGSSKRRAP